jgi:hypothetical protein
MMSRCGDGFIPELGNSYILPESTWSENCRAAGEIVRRFAVESPDINQKQQGSCTYSALLHCVMQRRAAMGMASILLAQCTGYAWDGISSSGEPIPRRSDTGMSLDVAIILGRMRGGIPVEHVDPLDYRRRNWPVNHFELGYDNSVDEWRDVSRSMSHIVSSLGNGIPVLHGYARHSRMLVRFDTERNEFEFKNTYGSKWNGDGFGWLTWRQVDEGRRQYGAFSPITVRDPAKDGDVPVAA